MQPGTKPVTVRYRAALLKHSVLVDVAHKVASLYSWATNLFLLNSACSLNAGRLRESGPTGFGWL